MEVVNFTANKKNPLQKKEKIKTKNYFKNFLVGGTVINLALSFGYLIMLNSLATRGFDLEGLKIEKMNLRKEIEMIDIALAIPTSLYALESNESVQMMDQVKEKTFFEIREGEVAFVGKKY